jgi:hypothetical protein
LDRLAESEKFSPVSFEDDEEASSSSAPSLESPNAILHAELTEEDRRRIMFGLTREGLSSRVYWALKLDLISDDEDEEEIDEVEDRFDGLISPKKLDGVHSHHWDEEVACPEELDVDEHQAGDEWSHPEVFGDADDDLALHRCPTRVRPWAVLQSQASVHPALPLPQPLVSVGRRRSSAAACGDAAHHLGKPDLMQRKRPRPISPLHHLTDDPSPADHNDQTFHRIRQWLAVSHHEGFDTCGGGGGTSEVAG